MALVFCGVQARQKRGFAGSRPLWFVYWEPRSVRFISDISMGYCAKLNTNSKPMKEKVQYAVLCAFRPWRSDCGEPELSVKEMKDGKMIENAPLKLAKATQIVAIGGLTASLCDAAVEAWLKINMGACFGGIRTTGKTTAGAADVGGRSTRASESWARSGCASATS